MDDASDLSRRIDDLLSGAIDEQMREQRVLADLMVNVRDGIAKLLDQVAGLGESVDAAREASERVQLAPAAAGPADGVVAERFESIETAIGELSATVSALADRPDPATLDPEEARRLFGTTVEAAREAASGEAGSIRDLVEQQIARLRDAIGADQAGAREALLGETTATREAVLAETSAIKEEAERQYAQLARRFAEAKERSDELESRLRAIESGLEPAAKAPEEMRASLNELTVSLAEHTDALLDQVQRSNEEAVGNLGRAAELLSRDASRLANAIEGIVERFGVLEESLLAYLQVRDLAMEEERDRVITELLEEFAGQMDAKQRRMFGSGMRGAWASRADKRAARRLRLGEANLPRMPQVPPEALRRASEGLARPATGRGRAAAVPAGRGAPVEAPRPAPVVPSGPAAVEPAGPSRKPAIVTPAPAQQPKPPSKAAKAVKPPAKKAAVKKETAPKKAPRKASPGEPAAKVASEESRGSVDAPETPADVSAGGPIGLEAGPAAAPGSGEPGLAPPPVEAGPEDEALAEMAALGELPADEPAPDVLILEPEPEVEPEILLGDAGPAPEIRLGREPPAAAPAAKKAKPPKGSKKPSTPEEKRAEKLARAARRRAERAAASPGATIPYSPESDDEEPGPEA